MLLEVNNLEVFYGRIQAIKGISFNVEEGEIVTLIGANGAGKSTTLKTISGVRPAAKGSIIFDGQDIGAIPARAFAQHPLRPRIQMVFQDPTDSLNPRYTAARAIADPLLRFGGPMTAAALRARCE